MPASISIWKRRAAPPSRVKIAVPLPNGELLIEGDTLVVGVDAQDAQHRAEDLVLVGLRRQLALQASDPRCQTIDRRKRPVVDGKRRPDVALQIVQRRHVKEEVLPRTVPHGDGPHFTCQSD
ncbi:hypothetical protein SALBM311S_00683 [Streptomyces alboniger]